MFPNTQLESETSVRGSLPNVDDYCMKRERREQRRLTVTVSAVKTKTQKYCEEEKCFDCHDLIKSV